MSIVEYIKEYPLRFFVPLVVIGAVIYWEVDKRKADDSSRPGREPMQFGTQGAAASENDRIVSIQRLQYTNTGEALRQLELVIQKPQGTNEAKQAAELYPQVLNLAFHARMKARDYDGAEALLKRLTEQFPEHFQTRSTVDAWGRELGERCRQALKAGQEEEADRLLEEILKGGHEKAGQHAFGEFRDFKAGKAAAAHAAGDAAKAEASLEQSARFFLETGWSPGMARALQGSNWKSEELFAVAEKWFAGGKVTRSIPLYYAVRQGMDGGNWQGRDLPFPERQKLQEQVQHRLFDALLQAGDELAEGKPSFISLLSPQQVYGEAVAVVNDRDLRIKALERELKVDVREVMAKAAPILTHSAEQVVTRKGLDYEAGNKLNNQLYEAQSTFFSKLHPTVNALWQEFKRRPNFDPWVFADLNLKANAWKEYPETSQEARRLEMLERTYQSANWPLPVDGIQEAEETMCEIYLRWGLLSCQGAHSDGIRQLRIALIHSRNPDLKRLVGQGLQAFIRDSRAQKNFEALYEMTVFYTGTFSGIKQDDPFRKELFGCLTDAAKVFQNKSPMKHVFMLSLLQEIYPETPEGRQALGEALKLSFAAAAVQEEDTKGAPRMGSSPIEGHTVIAVDNDTEYHLMCFYQGPETFFIRIPPYRRGSLAMKNGAYRVAVITTSDTVHPYRGAFTMQNEQRKSVYTVRFTGQQNNYQGFSSSATGEYALLRAPEALPNLKVNPKTGLMSP
jgi:tetratricopeptide (TPR) repeat protein